MIKHSPLTFIPDGVNKATNLDTDTDNSSIEDILTAADTSTQSQGQTVKGKEDAQHNMENVEERDVKNEQKLEQGVQEQEIGLQHDQDILLNLSHQRDRECGREQQSGTTSNTKEETIAKVHALQDSMKLLRDMLTFKRPSGTENSSQIDQIDGPKRQNNSAFSRGVESSQKESPTLYKEHSHLKDLTFQERLHLLQLSQNSSASSSDKPSSTTSNSESESNRQYDCNGANTQHKTSGTSVEETQEIDNSISTSTTPLKRPEELEQSVKPKRIPPPTKPKPSIRTSSCPLPESGSTSPGTTPSPTPGKSVPPSTGPSKCTDELEQSVKPKRIPPQIKPKPRMRTSSCPLPESGSTSPGTNPPPTPPRSADSIGRRHFWLPRPEEEKPEMRRVDMPSARRKGRKALETCLCEEIIMIIMKL